MINLDVLGPFQVVKRPMTLSLAEPRRPAAGSEKSGPLIWWPCDESQGITLANAAVNHLQGQVQGKPHWTPSSGKRGGALEFDGRENWVECPDSAELEFRSGLTVSAWFRLRSSDASESTLLAKGSSWQLLRQSEKGNLAFALTGPQTTGSSKGKPATITTKQAVDDSQWHHVAGVYDGQHLTLYLDGKEQGTLTAEGSLAPNNLPVTLGENMANRGSLFDGWMDDTQLYDRGLSAGEVAALFSQGHL